MRESSGSINIEKTLLKALRVLKLLRFSTTFCGGFAVQEHGYRRFTVDVDLIVPGVQFAREKLSMNGFKTNPDYKMTDGETKVEIDVFPGEGKVGPGRVSFPMPTKVSDMPQILSSSKVNRPLRNFAVDEKVRNCITLWNEIHKAGKWTVAATSLYVALFG